MKTYTLLLTNITEGILLTVAITGYLIKIVYRQIKKNKFEKRRTYKELSLLQQTHDEFEKLLSKNLKLPIALGY